MTKSELIALLAAKQPQLDYRDVELAVKELLEQMSAALAVGERLQVLATDRGSVRDFRVFAQQSGHSLLASEEVGGVYRYLIQKN